jgi:myosin heavy subunit
VVCLLLSIGALVLGMSLFGKRELLKGRAQKLETAIIQLGALIEAESPRATATQYPERDLSPATLQYVDRQDFSSFWTAYSNSYETADLPTMNLKSREIELMTYYARNANGKIVKDARGLKVSDGAGTMQGVLAELLTRAESQYNLLNDTRQQLATTRSELVATIQDLNQSKSGYRQALGKVQDLETEVARIKTDIEQARAQVTELQAETRRFQDNVAEERRQVQFLEEQKVELEDTVTQLKEEIATLRGATGKRPIATTEQKSGGEEMIVDPGIKGTVVDVNTTWNFAVLSLNEASMRELLGENMDQTPGPVEFMIKRSIRGEDTFVTKVRLQQINREKKLAIASIMTDWQQMDVKEGDTVFK